VGPFAESKFRITRRGGIDLRATYAQNPFSTTC
jgi:hypothetical protein